jgi:hypothetical protein
MRQQFTVLVLFWLPVDMLVCYGRDHDHAR